MRRRLNWLAAKQFSIRRVSSSLASKQSAPKKAATNCLIEACPPLRRQTENLTMMDMTGMSIWMMAGMGLLWLLVLVLLVLGIAALIKFLRP